jgi:iron(III) transport system substrate-binding protein
VGLLLVLAACAPATPAPAKPAAPAPTEAPAKPAAPAAAQPSPKAVTEAAKPAASPAAKPAEKTAPAADPLDINTNAELRALYEKARAEGELVFASSETESVEALIAGFTKRFPGIKMSHVPGAGGQMARKVIPELQAGGKATVDAFHVGGSSGVAMRDADAVLTFPYARVFGLPEANVLYDDRQVVWYHQVYGIIYNKKFVKPDEAPKTWEALLDPKWKGQIIVDGSAVPFQYLGEPQWLGDQKVKDFLTQLKAQQPQFAEGQAGIAPKVVSGQAPIGVTAVYEALTETDKGADLDFTTPPPTLGSYTFMIAVKGSQHPNAGILYSGWLATPEAQVIQEQHTGQGLVGPGATGRLAKLLQERGVQVQYISDTEENNTRYDARRQELQKVLGTLR